MLIKKKKLTLILECAKGYTTKNTEMIGSVKDRVSGEPKVGGNGG